MEHESDGDTSFNWSAPYCHQKTDKGTGGFGNGRTSGDHPNNSLIKGGESTSQ